MGFTTGLLGGFTLTTSVLYLSLHLHTQNRVRQAALLHQQSLIINNVVEPVTIDYSPPNRVVKAGLLEEAKDRWNRELESNVKKMQDTDWSAVGARLEESVSSLWRKAFEKGRESVKEVSK